MAYQAANPGPAKEITSSESGTIYRGFTALEETTMAFTSGSNVFSSRVYPAFSTIPVQINSIESISGAIAAYTIEPNGGNSAT